MISHFGTIDFIRRIDAAPDARALGQEMRRIGECYGFSSVIAGFVPRGAESRAQLAGRILFDARPAAWIKRYHEADYASVDPVLRKALREPGTSFTWARAAAEFSAGQDAGRGEAQIARNLMNEAREHGLAAGYCDSLLTLEGAVVAVSFSGAASELSPAAKGALNLAGAYAICKALQFRGALHANEPLTARERDCVRWCAEGKTDWEISRILGIAESTVRTHIDRARAKLNAGNRGQMIAHALRAGLIL